MNAIGMMLSGPLAEAIGWALLHLLWQGAVVAAILAATLSLMAKQKATARYIAACIALVTIVALGVGTAVRAYEGRGVRTDARVTTPGTVILAEPIAHLAHHDPLSPQSSVLTPTRYLPYVVLTWLLGVTLLSLRLVGGWVRAQRTARRNAQPAAAQWQRAVARLSDALRLRRGIALLESAAVEVPTVIGWLRPVILLPVSTLSGLSPEQLEMILAHELAHIRRHDFLVNLMQAAIETLLFYHPAVWWISRRIRIEREHCCDDVAIAVCGNPLQYARALTRLEELRATRLAIAANGGSLMTRIRRLVGVRSEAPNAPSRWAAGAALLTVLVAVIAAPSFTTFADDKKPAEKPAAKAKAARPPAPPKEAATTVEVNVDADSYSDAIADAVTPEPPEMPEAPSAATTPMPEPFIAVAPMPPPRMAITPMPAPRVAIAPMAPPAPMVAVAPMAVARAEAVAPPAIAAPESPRRHRHSINEPLTVDDLISLRAAGVDSKYIDSMKGAGLGDLFVDDLAGMRVQGITADWIRSMRDIGLEIKSAREAISIRVSGINKEWLAAMRAAGVNGSLRESVEMAQLGVTPEYIKQLRGAGYDNLTPRQLIELRAVGVTPEYIKQLEAAGFAHPSARDLVRLKASGVSSEFIREMGKYRTK